MTSGNADCPFDLEMIISAPSFPNNAWRNDTL